MSVNTVVEKCKLQDYMYNQTIKGEFSRYDLIVKYLFIQEYYKQNKPNIFKYKPYSMIVATRNRIAQPRKFISLIKSFEEIGYDEKYPLYMTRKYVTGGGKHRLACCLWFGVEEFSVIFREHYESKKRKYTKKKMIKYGFKKYMPLLKETKKQIFNNLKI